MVQQALMGLVHDKRVSTGHSAVKYTIWKAWLGIDMIYMMRFNYSAFDNGVNPETVKFTPPYHRIKHFTVSQSMQQI